MNLKSELQEDGQRRLIPMIHVLQPNIDVSLVAFKTVGGEPIYLYTTVVPVGTMRPALFNNAE